MIHKTKRILTCSVLGALVLILGTGVMLGQDSRTVDIGEMGLYTSESMENDYLAWPQGQPYSTDHMLETYGIYVGEKRTWKDPSNVDWEYQIAMVVEHKYSDFELVTPYEDDAFERVFRNPYPDRIVDGTNWTGTTDREDPVRADLPSDAMLYHYLHTWPEYGMNIDVERYTYFYAADQYDDFIIVEYILTNNSGSAKDSVLFGISGALNSSAYYPADLWGNYYGATYANYADGDASADSMRFWYGWDADEITGQPDIDDRGNPQSTFGHFQEPQSMGYVVLHADGQAHAPGVDEPDDPAQPHKAGWSYREEAPDLNVNTHEYIYKHLSRPWNKLVGQMGGAYSTPVDPDGNEVSFGDPDAWYRILDPASMIDDTPPGFPPRWDEHAHDPTDEQSKTFLMSFGPYDMVDGEQVRVVTAFVGGQIPHKLAIAAGRAYDNGNPALREDQMQQLPWDVYYNPADPLSATLPDGSQAVTIAEEGSWLNQDQKDKILELSKLRAFMKAGEVIDLWENDANDLKAGEGDLGIPLAPASPSLNVTSENEQVRIEWGDEAANDNHPNVGDLLGYRVYRNYWRPPALITPTDTTYVMIADENEVGPDAREYVDDDVIVGEEYQYYVTAVSETPEGDILESSKFQNRMQWSQGQEPAAPTRAPEPNWTEEATVVPNPFHIQAAEKYGGLRVNFMNLPPYCDIHIYTMTGDLVRTLEHTSGDGDEAWLRQQTFSQMQVVSGVYLYVIEERESPNGPKTGEKTIGKLVLIK